MKASREAEKKYMMMETVVWAANTSMYANSVQASWAASSSLRP